MAAPAIIPLLLKILPFLAGIGTQFATSKGVSALGSSPGFAGKFPRLAKSLIKPSGFLPGGLGILGFLGGMIGSEALLGHGEPPRDDTASLNNLLTQLQQPGPSPGLENDESLVKLLQQLQTQGRLPELLEQSGAVI